MCKVRAGGWLVVTFWVILSLVPSAAARVGNYLIVTAPDYASSDPLIQFKNAKSLQGLNVSVYAVPSGTTNTAIKGLYHEPLGHSGCPGLHPARRR